MSKKLILKAQKAGREIVRVTPESAHWKYVGFQALRLNVGDCEKINTANKEYCLLVLSGKVNIKIYQNKNVSEFKDIGKRQNVFEKIPPEAVYVSENAEVEITANSAAEVALCNAPADNKSRPPVLINASSINKVERGKGNNYREIFEVLGSTSTIPASLFVFEVFTPSSNSSSYPPHKHDQNNPPTESSLEETYFHKINPEQGFAFQRVYTDDRSLDEAFAVEHNDVVLVPRGYHPVVVPHGYSLYYLNVMAGPVRQWIFNNDPAHEWLIK